MSLAVPNPGSDSLSCGEMLEEWQKLWGLGERSFLIGLGWQTENRAAGEATIRMTLLESRGPLQASYSRQGCCGSWSSARSPVMTA